MSDLIPIFKLLHNKKSIILTGAGISCNAGIPDFRSSSGLYVKAINNSKLKGKEVFDVSILQTGAENVAVFAQFMNDLYLDIQQAQPTATHRFIDDLITKEGTTGCIRCYTQNIDDLEPTKDKVVQLHGNMTRMKCTSCGVQKPWDSNTHKTLSEGYLPPCESCLETQELRILSGKRSASYQVGAMKPDIILYGEFNHQHAENTLNCVKQDLKSNPDILLIMGTSLKVHGVKNLVKMFAKKIHTKKLGKIVIVNKEKLKGWEGIIDEHIEMDCDSFVNCYNSWRDSLKPVVRKASPAVRISKLSTPPSTPTKQRVKDFLAVTPSSTLSSSSSPRSRRTSKAPLTPSSTPTSGRKRVGIDQSMVLNTPTKRSRTIPSRSNVLKKLEAQAA
ncbi:hypothetical protein WICPIJ_000127 [Wickerhamomyces pijperi]|uniref:Deacetylase sirtuin-type domain-containing protein n=1 Tax=Wickerhamomyces pijperi TaxID=599730 RepID=A0A9P8QEC2_WICPI|nr:hypothetical protein WICPIJ_000127 [Wickerhamomyces pijperi]